MQLSENKALFQTVFDSASNGIAVLQSEFDTNGNVTDFTILLFNSYTLNWIGDIDYKNKLYGDVFPMVKKTGILEKFIGVAETGVTANFEQYYTGEGMKHWFHFTAVKQDNLLVVTTEDITERKQTEITLNNALEAAEKQRRLYDSITNNTPDLVYVFSLDYKFTYANKALLNMWGKTAEDAIGRGLRENGYEEWHAQMHEREIDEVAATKKSIRGTVAFPHAELGSRIYDYILVPVIDENGVVEAVAGTTRDITEIKRTEDRLVQSETRFRGMIDQTPAPTLVLMGDDLVVEQINQSMLKMIGQTEEIIGSPLIAFMPELKGSYIWNEVLKVYEDGTPFDQKEVLVSHKRTGIMMDYYYNIAYRPLKQDEKIIGMIQVAIDVTEQVTARKKLEESESRFRALVTASSDMVYSMNADWSELRQLEGRGFLTTTGESVQEWIKHYIHPADRSLVEKAIAEAISKKDTFQLEHRVLDVDGAEGWTYSRAVPILDSQDNILEWFGSAADITAQKLAQSIIKESAEDLRNLVLQSPIGICLMDASTLTSKIVNDKFVEIAGKPIEEIINKYYWDTFSEAAQYYEDALNEVVQSGKPFYANEVELMLIRHGKEEIVYVTFVYEPMKDHTGIVTKVVVFVVDNTPQVQARRKVEESENRYKILSETLEQQVNARTKELKRSNEDLQQFAHVASHDLKEPVRKIKTFAGRLEQHLKGKLDSIALQYIDRLHVATDRMFTMIDGVLNYSTTNAQSQKPETVDLNEVIKNIETDLEVILQKTGGNISCQKLPILEGAKVLLYQLFYNLINNSIKFAKTGEAPLIKISSGSGHEGFIHIILEDNGIGFSPDHAERIFDTFTRLNPKDDYEGTGLGLSLCKKIVERHGGTITAIGTPGKGATFVISLPKHQSVTGI